MFLSTVQSSAPHTRGVVLPTGEDFFSFLFFSFSLLVLYHTSAGCILGSWAELNTCPAGCHLINLPSRVSLCLRKNIR